MKRLMVGVGAAAAWVLCVVYWATLADCLEGKACSGPHLLLNEVTFGGIFVIPVVLLVGWGIDFVRRRET
jgi:hypothetical protein